KTVAERPGIRFDARNLVAIGMAKAAKLSGAKYHTYVVTGDGEMQEGYNWVAIMAAAQFKLDNLTLVIDHNRFQQGAALA
ncbi:1-deoxy-D-xylulose-5-phosphate synthase N-terminal domain-containing protein, partial [Rhizobium johnstonii]